MENLNENQIHRANQITGFVNSVLKRLPNKEVDGCYHSEAFHIIKAALYRETDESVIKYCVAKFEKWYDYIGVEIDWDFIEKNLPNYSSRQDVCNSNDLQKFVDGEMNAEDIDNYIYAEYGMINKEEARKILSEIDSALMKEALENFNKNN